MKYKKLNILFFIIALCTLLAIPNVFSQNLPVNSSSSFYYLPDYNLWLPGYGTNFSGSKVTPPLWACLPRYWCRQGGQKGLSDSIFTWQYVQTPVGFITDIFFIDSLFGWATYALSGYAGGVLRTTNSGFNWDSTGLAPGGSCMGVHFINRDTGWVVGTASRIRKTTNGGFNWVKQDTFYYGIYYNNFNSVHFFNPDTGIIIGERAHGYPDTSWGGCVLKTTNGGVNWNQVYSTNDTVYYSTELLRQFWLNNDTGWFAGHNILLKTTDGGITYTNYYSNIPPTQNGYNGLNDLYFINENTGWLCGSNLDHRNIYKTTNAGLNWIFQDNPVAYYQFPQINGIIFINSDTGWASSFYGFIIVTTNGGNNWVTDYFANNWNNKFTKHNDSKVWCTGDNGRIYFTLPNQPIGIKNFHGNVPKDFLLEQNHPNPFNSSTNISYQLPVKGYVRLVIFNILGEEIEKLVDRQQNAGKYQVNWDGYDYPTGIYFCRIEAHVTSGQTKNFIRTIKLVLLK